jgi:hypothetical protein
VFRVKFVYPPVYQEHIMSQAKPRPTPPIQASEHELLSHKDAEAGAPDDNPVAGEEDPGAAVEDFVSLDKTRDH